MPDSNEQIPVLLFGGTGYVAGEALRLVVHHPRLSLHAAYSTSQAGKPLTEVFAHLRGTSLESLRFAPVKEARGARELRDKGTPVAALYATPHGATAELVERLLNAAAELDAAEQLYVVDLSADFRFASAKRYEAVYGEPHPAPKRLADFLRGVPELMPCEIDSKMRCASQPGCFVTATVLAAAPLLRAGLVEPADVFVSAVTGSSGSGRTPRESTHHPERASNLFAYEPLAHRHEAEMRTLLAAHAGLEEEPGVAFVPHSGPFVRGIHATLHMRLREEYDGASADQLLAHFEKIYEPETTGRFVRISREMPRLNEVVGTNRCHMGLSVRGRTVVVTSVLDNLVKGAAGGGIQWLNRLLGFEPHAGLRDLSGLGWF